MNDPGVEDAIQISEDWLPHQVQHSTEPVAQKRSQSHGSPSNPLEETCPEPDIQLEHLTHSDSAQHTERRDRSHSQMTHSRYRPVYDKADEEESSIYQPTLWWFTSTAFPLFAGTFGPIANLFSVCALVQTWRVWKEDGGRVPDPPWLIALNACSLVLALAANIILLFNFARRIRYTLAQPLTISLWYLACIFLVIPIGLSHDSESYTAPKSDMAFSQSYYYALISSILYFGISTLLLISTLGATVFHAYPASFSTLTTPQRTLMLQTISFSLYLALGAGVFSAIEDWGFSDGVYWADYTLLTIGLGTDFPLTTTLGRMLLIPYAAIGITLIGLVVSSVRGLVLERAKAKVIRRHLGKEREKWKENINKRWQLADIPASTRKSSVSRGPLKERRDRIKHKQLMRLPRQLSKHVSERLKPEDQHGAWQRAEFELMRFIEVNAESTERYTALGGSFFIILLVWIGGSLVFWACERTSQEWTYPQSFYFTYTSLLTIGYGDFYPNSSAGKPFFVVWSLISVPAMTVLISNMADTVIKWVQDATVWASRWTILPERNENESRGRKKGRNLEKKKHLHPDLQRRRSGSFPGLAESPSSTAVGHVSSEVHPPRVRSPKHSHRKHKHVHEDDHTERLEQDVEQLAGSVEHFEEEEGRGQSLAAQVAREISHLAKHLNAKPPKKYTWEEWARWLEMLGEREEGTGGHGAQEDEMMPPPVPIVTGIAARNPVPEPPGEGGGRGRRSMEHASSELKARSNDTTGQSSGGADDATDGEKDWRWTWLGDQGPLFSRLTETEWIIEKLCFRLEKVLEDEIREARAGAKT